MRTSSGLGIRLADTIRISIHQAAEVVSNFVTWLLPFNLNGSATIGTDVTNGSTSSTWARTWDETNGILLQECPSGTYVSESMRLSYDTSEDGVTLGSENAETLESGNYTTDAAWSFSGGEFIASGMSAFQSCQTTSWSSGWVSGDTIRIIFTTEVTSGSVAVLVDSSPSSGVGTDFIDTSTTTTVDVVLDSTPKQYFRAGAGGFVGKVTFLSLKKITPVFLNSVSSSDSTKLHPSKLDSDGAEVMLLHSARDNNEAIESPVYSYDTADGATLGSEELVNGDASNTTSTDSSVAPIVGFTNWAAHDGSNKLTIDNGSFVYFTDGTNTGVYQSTLTSGEEYQLTVTVDDVSGATFTLYSEITEGSAQTTIGVLSAAQEYTFNFVATGTLMRIARVGGSNGSLSFSNLSAKQVTPATLSQGNGRRTTPSASPHNWWYQQQAMTNLWDDTLESTGDVGDCAGESRAYKVY